MKTKLNRILLIDDDEATNFLHQLIIEEMDITNDFVVKEDGEMAIEYLTTKTDAHYPSPDLILLDINMPRMNGWEFLESYKDLSEEQKGKNMIIMLTASLNPDDMDKAQKIDLIKDFQNKPLMEGEVRAVIEKHFPGFVFD